MNVFLDDERPTPDGWIRTFTPIQTIQLLETNEVNTLSLDHDLGDDDKIGTGYDVLNWIEQQVAEAMFVPPAMLIHSSNSSARVKMELAIRSIIQLHLRNVQAKLDDHINQMSK